MTQIKRIELAEYPESFDIDCDCLIVFIIQNQLQDFARNLPEATAKYIQTIAEDDNFSAKFNQILKVPRPQALAAKRLLLIGVGNVEELALEEAGLHDARLNTLMHKTSKRWLKLHGSTINLVIPSFAKKKQEKIWVKAISREVFASSYRFQDYKTTASSAPKSDTKITLTIHAKSAELLQDSLNYEIALDKGMKVTKDLANQGANICTPESLANLALQLAEDYPSIQTEIIEQQALSELGMGAYLAVNRASKFAASMPVISYFGAEKASSSPIVLIGKGVTFDTGGITLKKAAGMHHMIYDMGGAASVIGTLIAAATLRLPINVIGILATAENALDGHAYRPGDVLTTLSGQTVEVISTDAEGRLLLCDALAYAQRFSPKSIIDIATLTGAAITALGHQASGLMCNNPKLESALLKAGEDSTDRAWSFPLWPEYQESLASTCADMKNTGDNSPGMITAGCFLSKFVANTPWAHLDVAGTAFKYGKQNTATGRPVPLLLEYLCNESRHHS